MRIAAIAFIALFSVTARGQSRVPRLPDGKPNLSGVWQAMNTANWDLEEHLRGKGW